MAQFLIDCVVTKLKESAGDEFAFQWGFKEEMELLGLRLDQRKSQLIDAEGKTIDNASKILVSQFKDITFKIEDVIEEFILEMKLAEANKPANIRDIMSCTTNIFYFLKQKFLVLQFHQQLKSINKELDVLPSELSIDIVGSSNQIREEEEEEDKSHQGLSSPYVEDLYIIGIEKHLADLEKLVEESKEQMYVITIWGPGGCGKTTLIKQLYKNIQLSNNVYAWVYVGRTNKVEGILMEMVKEFHKNVKDKVPDDIDKKNFLELQSFLLNYLKDKRYILILDDVWDPDVFSQIEMALPKLNMQSSIIITTRDENVASRSRLGKHHYLKVEHLHRDLSWDLFCKVAFRNYDPRGCCPDYLNDVANKLVNRCKGLPLAIVVVASLMAIKGNNREKWEAVIRRVRLNIEDNLNEVNQNLLLSYKHLPRYLKNCFLYCALFPKGHQLSIKKLACLLIAEGLVEKKIGITLEEVARDYFLQLNSRSMIILGKRTFQMHDLMHDVAIPILTNENFGFIFSEQTTCNQLDTKQRRLFLHETSPTLQLNNREWKPRSLISCSSNSFESTQCQISSNFKLLRVLDLDGGKFESLPDELGDLIHIRYLGLRGTSIRNFPASFAKLHHLQTLDARNTEVRSLPEWIIGLKQLRHLLLISHFWDYAKLHSATFKSTELQTLSGIGVEANQVSKLVEMKQVRKLKISVSEIDCHHDVWASLVQMDNLQSLSLKCLKERDQGVRPIADIKCLQSPPECLEKLHLFAGIKLPSFLGSNCNLQEIKLWYSDLHEDPFPVLGELPNLMLFSLHQAYVGKEINCGPDSFSQLKHLSITLALNLTVWNHALGSMKRLETLSMTFCPRLRMLPDVLQSLKELQEVVVLKVDKNLLAKIAVDGPEHEKVKHIPKIICNGETLQHAK